MLYLEAFNNTYLYLKKHSFFRSYLGIGSIFICVVLGLFYLIYPLYITHSLPSGDLAADMLLADRISEQGYLLLGHYSRWTFNHPGPFFFYYNYLIEFLFGWLPTSRVQNWFIGGILLNAIFLTYSAVSLSKYLEAKYRYVFACVFLLIFISYQGAQPLGLWMPLRLLAPYLAFMVTLLHISRGDFRYLTLAVLCISILVHGYVTMPILTIPFFAIACVLGAMKLKRLHQLLDYKITMITSCLVALFFMLPMFLDFVLRTPSNISLFLKFPEEASFMQKTSFRDICVLLFNLLIKGEEQILFFLLLSWGAMVYFFQTLTSKQKENILTIYYSCVFVLLGTILYYSTTPAPLHSFSVFFIKALPPLFIVVTLFPIYQYCTRMKLFRVDLFKCMAIVLGLLLFVSTIHERELPKCPLLS